LLVRTALGVTLVIMPCVGALVSVAGAATFRVEPSKSSLVAEIFRDGAASRFAHDHVVQATNFSGRIIFEPAVPEASSISIQVNTATLRVDSPETRRQFRSRGEPTTADVSAIEHNMKAEGQLYVAKFPLMTFLSTTITSERDGQYWVTGHLTIRGVTKLVRFPANVVMEGQMLRGTATLEFAQSAFGYGPYSALLGAIRNKDAVVLHIDLVAIPE
jgi:polyisoprenoid-binding protein YceI